MLGRDLKSPWGNDTDEVCNLINEATCHINQYKNNRFLKEKSREYFEKLLSDIKEVLVKWTGDTYVGCPKEERLQKTYQNFFEALLCLLLFLKEKDTLITRKEKEFYQSCLYNGTLYRYIGSNYYNNEETIKPRFDGIYVSWSKNSENDYLRSKLYGPITWLKCEVKEPMYAIDLNYFGVSRGNEEEVVFPTIEKCITDSKFIYEE